MTWLKAFLVDLIAMVIAKLFKKELDTMEYGESGEEFESSVQDQIDDQIPDGPGGPK